MLAASVDPSRSKKRTWLGQAFVLTPVFWVQQCSGSFPSLQFHWHMKCQGRLHGVLQLTNLRVHGKGELLRCYKMGNIGFVSQLLPLIIHQPCLKPERLEHRIAAEAQQTWLATSSGAVLHGHADHFGHGHKHCLFSRSRLCQSTCR